MSYERPLYFDTDKPGIYSRIIFSLLMVKSLYLSYVQGYFKNFMVTFWGIIFLLYIFDNDTMHSIILKRIQVPKKKNGLVPFCISLFKQIHEFSLLNLKLIII